ncbi:hypothetical protein [Orlajensenia leifsoniae]|uniref:Ricin B lectin domain-containing protein n=1 Tax=Orlajensenia leifsoniae TaxID=2561933 RepID=A0A4Y9R695_9MICO|nr:hypothetical protein [Leifsonia flava]TFW00125.1 hypothetical protein E4M00_02730 [Leifsonia flava]
MSHLRWRVQADPERGSALISALIFMLLLASLSLVLASVLLAQAVPEKLAFKGTRTVYAAESGMQSTLGVLRSIPALPDASGKIYGNKAKLPCAVSGTVDGVATGARYAATIRYYATDPGAQTDAWRNSTTNQILCTVGAGTAIQPKYALIVSVGQDAAVAGQSATFGNRSLAAVYEFPLTNVNIPGGYIYAFGTTVCLQAEGLTAGSLVRYQTAANCNNPTTQYWVYDTNYTLRLASSTLTATPLCITGPTTTGSTATEKVKLQACKSSSDTTRSTQLWSYEGGDRWRGQNTTISTGYNTLCLSSGQNTTTPTGGVTGTPPVPLLYLSVGTLCADKVAWGSFTPQAAVGPGNASYATKEVTNYKEFGRCLDVTAGSITSTYMITYPCKQDPSGTGTPPGTGFLYWNHKWFYNEPAAGASSAPDQDFYVYDGSGTKKCLQTPLDTASSKYVIFTGCSSSEVRQDWTRVGSTGDYATSYLFLDTYGRCLAINPADLHDSAYSKVVVATCNGSTLQKWNAPPNSTSSSFGSYRELGG